MTDALDSPAIRFCWCPPMDNPDDPDQHEAACAHAVWVAYLQNLHPPTTTYPFRPRATTSGCYEASFGWVHVKPGCHCTR